MDDAIPADPALLAERHGVPVDAVQTVLDALRRGGGRQAQFSHPALGGMGQWSRGGGIMIGAMFDHALKAKVARLCDELADAAGADSTGVETSAERPWWPSGLGRPSASGSQNGYGYACFPETRRLAIRDDQGVRFYDTGEHRISGVSQQQGGTRDLAFTSQNGLVRQSDLEVVEEELAAERDDAEPDVSLGASAAPPVSDAIRLIERLHDLQRKGVITQQEFEAKKTELLGRL